MSNTRTTQRSPPLGHASGETREDWEDWEDDEATSPLDSGDEHLISPIHGNHVEITGGTTKRAETQTSISTLASRPSMQRLRRLKSRQRQKAQNAIAGIKLVTDMTAFRQQQQQQQQQQHTAQQLRPKPDNRASRTGKYVDAAALQALEGGKLADSPSTFGWLKKKPSSKGKRIDRLIAETPTTMDLSPATRPIMIGFAMPADSNIIISPQTATVETPVEYPMYFTRPTKPASPRLQNSAWSPDTDDGETPSGTNGTSPPGRAGPPAIPPVPSSYRSTQSSTAWNTQASTIYSDEEEEASTPRQLRSNKNRDTATTAMFFSDEEDDMATPVTLFEEDGSPLVTRQKSFKQKGRLRANTTTSLRSQGWWDQITSPFGPKTPVSPQLPSPQNVQPHASSPVKAQPQESRIASPVKVKVEEPRVTRAVKVQTEEARAPRAANVQAQEPRVVESVNAPSTQPAQPDTVREWWKDVDVKIAAPTPPADSHPPVRSNGQRRATRRPPQIIVEDVSPSSEVVATEPPRTESWADRAHIITEENAAPNELPPPYSPPSRGPANVANVRYRAVFPPGHALNAMYPPSPGPVSPGMANTMASQGAISLTEVPLTPPAVVAHESRHLQLPERSLGNFISGDHLQPVSGRGPRQKAERKRRRHEKEDALARKVGGFWKGRGCIPGCCCCGRKGREGRKKRRVCLGVCGGILALIILAIVLGVTLSRRGGGEYVAPSPWLNLTTFPPIPTGISTVIGPNSDTTTSCVQPPTLWSCALPKEQATSNGQFEPDQPSFIFQIQFDNNTQQLWNVQGQEPPHPSPLPSKQARSGAVGVASLMKRLATGATDLGAFTKGISPNPAPPNFQDMFFLGNTTDGVVSDDKAGEPTPFFITVLKSLGDSAGPNMLSRRQITNQTIPSLNGSSSSIIPPPVLDIDGTGAPAVLLPFPTQQPLRLYDRGLPTERYGFYTYYNKTIYVKSTEPLDKGQGPVPADQKGGSLKSEAKFVVTWSSARYKVEMWTRRSNSTKLVGRVNNGGPASLDNNTQQPGTMPYPVTVTLDTHGGIPNLKFTYVRDVDVRQRIVPDSAQVVLNFMNTKDDLINPSNINNPSFGGVDGGTGGCKCAYTNFVGLSGQRLSS
ncbi:hypothetical protein B0H63DRAFT_44988 [Podospora didyma]|uniref:Glycoprotease family protein n=1 Tax=Podospora didyma TaxID=330526 RepID=A0AAE0P6Q6_9PEZI|nr:hypothetical protein B0H63DRAFT_44988 [Podospora didyma]